MLDDAGLFETTTFIFRVPFVQKEVVDSLVYSLNDVLSVKAICFPPLGVKELNEFAKKELATFGLSISDDAWDNFQERIAEERADGKFYDLKTIDKIVRELVYNKQLDNAKNGKNSTTITAKDTEKICVYKPLGDKSVDELFDALVCGEDFKKKINEIVAQVLIARKTGGVKPPCIHMRFVGNPGTGKTTLARIVGKVFREKGVLRVGNFFECAGRDLVGRYIGETAPKTASICRDAYGSVLFIDEAYSLYKGSGD
jgi:SpoVK/Ycf46/Vps4 family AAA+-type ATPase